MSKQGDIDQFLMQDKERAQLAKELKGSMRRLKETLTPEELDAFCGDILKEIDIPPHLIDGGDTAYKGH